MRAAPGVTQHQLQVRVRAILPRGVQAITGQHLAEENIALTTTSFLSLFQTFLLTFAGVALLVGLFSIYNTFSIIAAQRAQEWAVLRMIGASRGQRLTAVVSEALAIGLIASVVGLGGGLGVITLLEGLFVSLGLGLPVMGLVFTATTATVSVAVGTVVTLLACLLPAVRASRVSPLAALQAAAVEPAGPSRTRTMAGSVSAAAGVGLVLASALVSGNAALLVAGLGALGAVVGMVVLGKSSEVE